MPEIKKKGYPKYFSYEDEDPSSDELVRRRRMERGAIDAMKSSRKANIEESAKRSKHPEFIKALTDYVFPEVDEDSGSVSGTVDEYVEKKKAANQRRALRQRRAPVP
jgi:hypothetical protein